MGVVLTLAGYAVSTWLLATFVVLAFAALDVVLGATYAVGPWLLHVGAVATLCLLVVRAQDGTGAAGKRRELSYAC